MTGGLEEIIEAARKLVLNQIFATGYVPCLGRLRGYMGAVLDHNAQARSRRSHSHLGLPSSFPRGPRTPPRRSTAICSGWPRSSARLRYLRGICGTNEGTKWRNEMQALIDAETPCGERRARMIAGFNRGYNGFQQTYRTCTPAASVAIRRYIEEGSEDFAGSDGAVSRN